ncbi:hypothetical protein AVEN_215300-1 [Araneus ventricosus]|uniref:Uncharacterized protein n=1 Tax=Araneus ventricosus TaxID=182803 RepID=A0A4Y2PY36_ARAVE|nr:hypothetical protein AVEN_215300-1 [Araneus ventricosus]
MFGVYMSLVHVKYDADLLLRLVWSGCLETKVQLRCSPRHLIKVRKDKVLPKIAFALLPNGTFMLSAPPAPLPIQPVPAEEKAGGGDSQSLGRQTMTTASRELATSSDSLTLKRPATRKRNKGS